MTLNGWKQTLAFGTVGPETSRVNWAKDRLSAFSAAVGARRFALAAIFSAAVGAFDHIPASLRGSGTVFGFPSWIFGVLLLSTLISWWLLDYTVRLRRQLRGAIDLEKALDALSQLFDEGNNKIFNAVIGNTTEYANWHRKTS